jgi:tripeptide aminopeptidase
MPSTLSDQVLELALAIQQIPAPTFGEEKRAAFMRQQFQAAGLSDIQIDAVGNVVGRLPGRGEKRPLVVSAHLDTVFPSTTDLTARLDPKQIAAPGIGDNSTGLAGLLGLVWALQEKNRKHPAEYRNLPGDVWLVANVGEEGLGNLRGIQAVVDRFESLPLAYIVLEGIVLGAVYHRGLGVQRYQITARTAGGHSWKDYGKPSAIHELATLITQLTGLSLPVRPPTTLNVGMVVGGTSVNTIAAEAHLELDLRSEDASILVGLASQVEALVQAANRPDVQVTAEIIGQRPAGEIPPDHPLVLLAMRCLEEQGISPRRAIGSTDANLPLSRGLPSITIGLTTGEGAHTVQETIHTRPLAQGLAQLTALVEGVFQIPI